MKRILIVTSAFERAHFFPGGLEAWMACCAADCRSIDASDADGFTNALKEFAPQVVVGAWDMPALPLEAVVAKGGSVEYFCFVCGSAKKQITAAHLEAGLVLSNWGAWVAPYVAECALLLVLNALRRVARWGHQLKAEGAWRDRNTHNHSLFGKRVGLHGFGGVARALTKLMQPFDPVVTTWDPWVKDEVLAEYNVKRAASVEALFAEAEVLVELLPLTQPTERIVDEKLLRLLPTGSCFINIGRGAVVDEAALGRVAGEGRIEVALDVYALEPLPVDSPLRTLSNVFLLPHMGGATVERGVDCGQRALQNVARFLAGEAVQNVVGRAMFERTT